MNAVIKSPGYPLVCAGAGHILIAHALKRLDRPGGALQVGYPGFLPGNSCRFVQGFCRIYKSRRTPPPAPIFLLPRAFRRRFFLIFQESY